MLDLLCRALCNQELNGAAILLRLTSNQSFMRPALLGRQRPRKQAPWELICSAGKNLHGSAC
jgi:hypothetical protein